ncbi:hypothetical protein [Aureibacillus halotolerans]|nr:hypothetical protein [Aureibacillus halotolerans]
MIVNEKRNELLEVGELTVNVTAWIFFILLFFVCWLIRTFTLRKQSVNTASGAIVMALGIFLNGAAHHFAFLSKWDVYLVLLLFVIWLFIAMSFFTLAIRKELGATHLSDPIQTFAVGTWIAGTAVCATIMAQRLPEFIWIAHSLAMFSVVLWIYYLGLSLRNFQRIWKKGLYAKVHGVVLLSTVSTQSLVILFKTLYTDLIPNAVYVGLISLGVGFYVLGFALLLRRYLFLRRWNVCEDWANTNCILHGAMSISGLAILISGAIPADIGVMIWLWVLLWFVIVEGIEVWRAAARIRKYGWVEGIGSYNVSQWSRNFTFGMLYAFTLTLHFSHTAFGQVAVLYVVKDVIVDYLVWLIVLLLINECLLFMKNNFVFGGSKHKVQERSR